MGLPFSALKGVHKPSFHIPSISLGKSRVFGQTSTFVDQPGGVSDISQVAGTIPITTRTRGTLGPTRIATGTYARWGVGTLTVREQMRSGSVPSDRVNLGTLGATRVPSLSITSKTTGTLGPTRIATGTYDRWAVGTLNVREQMRSGTVPADRIRTGTIGAARIAIGTYPGFTISTGAFNSTGNLRVRRAGVNMLLVTDTESTITGNSGTFAMSVAGRTWRAEDTAFYPVSDAFGDFGKSARRVRDLYLSRNFAAGTCPPARLDPGTVRAPYWYVGSLLTKANPGGVLGTVEGGVTYRFRYIKAAAQSIGDLTFGESFTVKEDDKKEELYIYNRFGKDLLFKLDKEGNLFVKGKIREMMDGA